MIPSDHHSGIMIPFNDLPFCPEKMIYNRTYRLLILFLFSLSSPDAQFGITPCADCTVLCLTDSAVCSPRQLSTVSKSSSSSSTSRSGCSFLSSPGFLPFSLSVFGCFSYVMIFPIWFFPLQIYYNFFSRKKRLLYSLIFDTWELPHIEHIFGQTTKHWKLVIVLFLNEKGRNDVKLIYCTSRTFWSPASLLSEYKVVNKLLIIILLYLYYYNVIATTVD